MSSAQQQSTPTQQEYEAARERLQAARQDLRGMYKRREYLQIELEVLEAGMPGAKFQVKSAEKDVEEILRQRGGRGIV